MQAQQFGRGLNRSDTDTFVGMYVNQLTLDYGTRGLAASGTLLRRGYKKGLVPSACPSNSSEEHPQTQSRRVRAPRPVRRRCGDETSDRRSRRYETRPVRRRDRWRTAVRRAVTRRIADPPTNDRARADRHTSGPRRARRQSSRGRGPRSVGPRAERSARGQCPPGGPPDNAERPQEEIAKCHVRESRGDGVRDGVAHPLLVDLVRTR